MVRRLDASVTSVSWIPSEAVAGLPKIPFTAGIAHHDDPPPDRLDPPLPDALAALRRADRFRFANHLAAFVDVEDRRVVGAGYSGGGMIGATTLRLGRASTAVTAVAMSDRRTEPEIGDGWVRFSQTCGGRTGVPAPRTVRHPPFVQFRAPTAWTTLSLTVHVDGTVEHALIGASPFPRHWVYGPDGALVAKSGLIDFTEWYTTAFGVHTPWGDLDSPALATEVETALERQLSVQLMHSGESARIRRLRAGSCLVTQGDVGDDLFLLLDGVLVVEVDGKPVAEVGPGAMLGERAGLECGRRSATLRAVTACKVACAPASAIEGHHLAGLAEGHRREDSAGGF